MEAEKSFPVQVCADYATLLTRYARILIRNEMAAKDLVQMALAEAARNAPAMSAGILRDQLKRSLRDLCFSWNLAQDALSFKGRAIREEDL